MFRALLGMFGSTRTRRSRRPQRRAQAAERVSGTNFAPSGGEGGGDPKVLLANMSGDTGGAISQKLSELLGTCDGIEVYRSNKELKQPKDADLVRRLMASAELGREMLAEQQADILLWGEVQGDNLRLRFVPMIPCNDNLPGAFGLGDTLELPASAIEDLLPAVHASVLAAVGPTFQGMKGRISKSLGQAMQTARGVVQAQPEGASSAQHATMLTTLGNAFSVQYRLSKNAKNLENAAAVYRSAVKRISADSETDIWAVAQSHYATALKAIGTADKDEDALKQAAVAYQEITETLGRDRHPYDWALAHINHGLVLYRLSMRTGRANYLQEAGKAFEEALTVYTKEIMPARWAEVMNQYGVILMAHGEQVTGNVTLELAVKKFRKVMEVRKRDRSPQLWAQTANNLGAACFALAKRNAEVALLREAVSCFEGAAEVYLEAGQVKKAEVIQSNMARVQRLLSARGG